MAAPARQYEPDLEPTDNPSSFDISGNTANENMQNQVGNQLAAARARGQQALQEQMMARNSTSANDNQPLSDQQQAQAAADMEAYKQRALAQIAQKKSKLEQQLAELEKDLTDFKNGSAVRVLGIAFPGIGMMIDNIIQQMKKRVNKMSKEAQIKFYETMISALSGMKAALTGLKIAAAFLDAAFVDKASCFRLVLFTSATIIIPIILILISPLYILFLAVLIYVNRIPLVKGVFTDQIEHIKVKVDNHIKSFRKKLDILQPDVVLRRQIAKLDQTAAQVQSGQITYRGRNGIN